MRADHRLQGGQMVAENTTGVDCIVAAQNTLLIAIPQERAEGAYPTMLRKRRFVQA